MREILFRGFSKNKNGTEKVFYNGKWYKGKWVEGCYFMAKDNKCNILHCISEIKGEQFFKIIPETVGQYIGLTDKNGNRIFEGDIIRDDPANRAGVIKFGKYGIDDYGFYVDWGETFDPVWGLRNDLPFWVEYRAARVIGNIYDNPEFLETRE